MQDTKYSQPTSQPTAKVSAAGIGGSLSVVLIYVITKVFHVDLPPEIAAAISTIISFGSGYLVRDVKPRTAAEIITNQ